MIRNLDGLRKTFGTAAILALGFASLQACADKREPTSPMQDASTAQSPKMQLSREAVAGNGGAVAQSAVPAAPPAPGAPALFDQPTAATTAAAVTPSMIIRNGTASIEVDSLELAIAAVQKLAATMGGYVGNTTQTTGANMVRSADIELKIPSSKYDATVGNLGPIGKLESQTSTAEDVGEEFFDVTARQANARRLEERLTTLLATRTGKLEDVLAVERELARVREEIERYEGRLRYLKAHVSTSTLMINLHEKRSVVSGYNGTNIITESFKDAWRNFVQFIAYLISSLGFLIPIGVVLVLGFLVARRIQRSQPTETVKRRVERQPPE